jgi:glutathione S-transferase
MRINRHFSSRVAFAVLALAAVGCSSKEGTGGGKAKSDKDKEDGGGAPAADVIRAAKVNVRYHLAYIGWLARTRNFLAGDRLTYADLVAAAHLSAIDYLGDVPWSEDDAAKAWYARVKSRPSFRPLLSEWLAGVPASQSYVDLDF